MNRDEIAQGLRALAMGRPNHPSTEALVDALAVLLATPEERLEATVRDEPEAPVKAKKAK